MINQADTCYKSVLKIYEKKNYGIKLTNIVDTNIKKVIKYIKHRKEEFIFVLLMQLCWGVPS